MKKFLFILFIIPMLVNSQDYKTIEIGESIPLINKPMLSTNGKNYSLKDIKMKNGLLVIFSSNTCPFVIMWEDRFKTLEEICKKNNIGMVYVNSNEKKRDGDDSFDEMKKHSFKNSYQFPYLLDKNSLLANAFNAKTTPHVFLFGEEDILVYKGVIDDNFNSAKNVNHSYLINAIDKILTHNEVTVKETKPIGCSIKRVRE